jgi:hypothetical protein
LYGGEETINWNVLSLNSPHVVKTSSQMTAALVSSLNDVAILIEKFSRSLSLTSLSSIFLIAVIRRCNATDAPNGLKYNIFFRFLDGYANRVPLQFQPGACLPCLIFGAQSVMNMNWRSYGLQQAKNQLPRGAVTVIEVPQGPPCKQGKPVELQSRFFRHSRESGSPENRDYAPRLDFCLRENDGIFGTL